MDKKEAKQNYCRLHIPLKDSLAVVIDEEYMRSVHLNISATIRKTIDDIVRENLRHGGVNVRYYSWTGVHLKRDCIAAITITDCLKTWKFYNAIQINSILHLAITDSECPRLPVKKSIMMPILKSGHELPQILLDMRVQQVLNWDSTVLLYDSGYDGEITSIIHSLSISNKDITKPLSVYVFKIEDITSSSQRYSTVKNSFDKLRRIKKKRFIVLSENYKEILTEALRFNYLNVYNEWLLFMPNAQYEKAYEIAQNASEGSHIAFALNKTSPHCKLQTLCAIQELTMGFITSYSKITFEENSLFGQISDEEWEAIRFTKEEKITQILASIRVYLRKNNECSACMKWSLESLLSWGYSVDIQKQNVTDRKKLIHIGNWVPIFGYSLRDVLFPNFDHKFRNMTLNILTQENPPWQIIKRDENNNIVEQSGIVMEILHELSLRLNFTYVIEELYSERMDAQKNIGRLEGTLTNYVHPSLRQATNLKHYFVVAIATSANGLDRYPFNFSIPISVQQYTFLSKLPEEVSRLYLFTAPFSKLTWLCLGAVILFITPFLYVMNRLLPLEEMKTVGLLKMKNCFWYIYGALLQQGGLYLPSADSGRVTIGVWWIAVIVLVTTYCGNLVAFLTFPNLQPGLNYFLNIFEHNDIKTFGLRNGTYFEQYMKYTTRDEFKRAMAQPVFYGDTIEEDIKEVEKGKRINIDWKINLKLVIQKHFDEHKKCSFMLAKEDFVDEPISLIIPEESPYFYLINDEIYRLHQMGFIDKWHKKYLTTTNKCESKGLNRQITNHKVNLSDMQGCFLVLFLGLASAVFIIGLEFAVNHIMVARYKRNIISTTVMHIAHSE